MRREERQHLLLRSQRLARPNPFVALRREAHLRESLGDRGRVEHDDRPLAEGDLRMKVADEPLPRQREVLSPARVAALPSVADQGGDGGDRRPR